MDERFLKRLPTAAMVAAVAAVLVYIAIVASGNDTQLASFPSLHKASVAMRDVLTTPAQPGWAADRIIDLPEDGSQFYLTVFTHDDWKARGADRELLAWFDTHPGLRSLQRQTHYLHLSPNSRMFQTRWPSWRNSLPAVLLQQGNPHTGKVCYKAGPTHLPTTSYELARQLDVSLDALRDLCPVPPRPRPDPLPVIPVTPDIPDITPDTTPATPGVNSGIIAIAIGIAVGLLALCVGVMGTLLDHVKKAFKGQAT